MQQNPRYNEHNPETQTENRPPNKGQIDMNRSQCEQVSSPGVLFNYGRHMEANRSQSSLITQLL